MDERELKQRTKQFALRCMKLADSLPRATPSGRAVAQQLVDCGTSVGSNYRAACRGRSHAEFVAKLGVVEEEADESAFWMELVIDSGLKPHHLVDPLREEADQITRIMTASIKSARRAAQSKINNPKSKIR